MRIRTKQKRQPLHVTELSCRIRLAQEKKKFCECGCLKTDPFYLHPADCKQGNYLNRT